MKESKDVLLTLLIIILLVIAMCMFYDYIKNSKMETISNLKEYRVETRNGNKITVKTNNAEWAGKVLPKKLNLEQEFAMKTWRDILNVSVSERDERLEKTKAEDKIYLLVKFLAAMVKTGKENPKDVIPTNKDIKRALSLLLNETSPIAADMFVGNWDGYCSVPELNEFINYPETSFQVRIVKEIMITYSSF